MFEFLQKSHVISFCVKKQEFVVGTHLNPENCSKSLDFFKCVGITRGTVGITYEQNRKIMTSSNSELKIAKKFKVVVES